MSMAYFWRAISTSDSQLSLSDAENIRDQYIINYADYLHSDPGLWRLTVDYLCTCGDIGQEMADEVLLRIPLKVDDLLAAGKHSDPSRDVPMEVEGVKQEEEGDLSGIVQELNATCHEYQREHTRRTICRVECLYPSQSAIF